MAGGANPQQTVMAGGTNPYQQAAGAQTAAMNRVGQGMYQTAADGMMNYANPYENQVVQASLRDVGNAASQGLITTPGGELVSAKKAASTMHKAGKHAVRKARKKTGKLTYGRRPDGSKMSTGQGGRGDTRKSQRNSTTILGNALVEALKERCWKGYEPTPDKKAYSKGSCKPKSKKRK